MGKAFRIVRAEEEHPMRERVTSSEVVPSTLGEDGGREGREGRGNRSSPSIPSSFNRHLASNPLSNPSPSLGHATYPFLSCRLFFCIFLIFNSSPSPLHSSHDDLPSPSSSHRSFLLPTSSNVLPDHHRQRIIPTSSRMGRRFFPSLHQGSTRFKVQGQETQQDRPALRKGSRDGR